MNYVEWGLNVYLFLLAIILYFINFVLRRCYINIQMHLSSLLTNEITV